MLHLLTTDEEMEHQVPHVEVLSSIQINKQTRPRFPNAAMGREKGGAVPLEPGFNAAKARWQGGKLISS
uniref:Uncharacterized protein n=1 Tax=Knipowitschia caucasica TaxID=637954 RepID=A0AAV2JDY4_KNICA